MQRKNLWDVLLLVLILVHIYVIERVRMDVCINVEIPALVNVLIHVRDSAEIHVSGLLLVNPHINNHNISHRQGEEVVVATVLVAARIVAVLDVERLVQTIVLPLVKVHVERTARRVAKRPAMHFV